MRSIRKILTSLIVTLFLLPVTLFAQNEGTYIDNLGVQDSTYMDDEIIATSAQSSGSTTIIIVVAALIVVALVIFFLVRKKKKSS